MPRTRRTARTVKAGTIDLERSNGKQVLKIQILPELEELFKTRGHQVSEKYLNPQSKGLKFYELKDKLNSYTEKYNSNRTKGKAVSMRVYGSEFVTDGGKANVSILRTVGISRGIEVNVDDLVLDHELKEWTDSLAYYIKFLYESFINKTKVTAEITFEY